MCLWFDCILSHCLRGTRRDSAALQFPFCPCWCPHIAVYPDLTLPPPFQEARARHQARRRWVSNLTVMCPLFTALTTFLGARCSTCCPWPQEGMHLAYECTDFDDGIVWDRM